MCCRQGVLSAVWRMTLVSMALQAWGGEGRALGLSGAEVRAGSPVPHRCVELSVKLGLWGGVILCRDKGGKAGMRRGAIGRWRSRYGSALYNAVI